MWEEARRQVAATFFHDTILLYRNEIETDELGEELETPELVGEYACNIENGQSGVAERISGTTTPQTLRISLSKATPLSYDYTYKVKVKSARIAYDSNEYWRVDGWVEGQISTVITASREVAV